MESLLSLSTKFSIIFGLKSLTVFYRTPTHVLLTHYSKYNNQNFLFMSMICLYFSSVCLTVIIK